MSKKPKKHHKENTTIRHDKIHYNIAEDIDIEKEIKEPKWKKPLIKITAIILILLTLSFLLPLGRIGSIVESKKIDENYIINLKDSKIIFTKDIYENIKDRYTSSKTEIKVCLIGNKTNNDYIITDLYYPRIYRSTYDSVTSQSCNKKTLISLHSHPNTWCIFSNQDIESYKQLKKQNNKAFIGLICDIDKFNFHGY